MKDNLAAPSTVVRGGLRVLSGMFHNIDLEALAEQQGPERTFLSLYLSGPEAMASLEQRIHKVRELLDDSDELEHFEENLALIQDFLDTHDFDAGALCVFACWMTDYLQAYALEKGVPDLLWIDSSPYIRPIAELQDEYENFVVVAADNTDTQVYSPLNGPKPPSSRRETLQRVDCEGEEL